MLIKNHDDITAAVLEELQGAQSERFRQIMESAVRHLHGFIRDAKLTELEFQQTCAVIARLGQATNESHNEVVLAAGSLGISALVCLLNNGERGGTETTANLLGPFWRPDSPFTENGGSIVRSATPGDPLIVTARVLDSQGQEVRDAEVDVWHSSNLGYYENQDPEQADMNLRGTFKTNAEGRIWFRSIKPLGYPIPVNGPVGELLRIQGRHNMRPAHVHFLIRKQGFKTQFSQVYASDDPHLDSDVQFAVTQKLVGNFVRHAETHPNEKDLAIPWYSLDYDFVLEAGESRNPKAPISGKATTERPQLTILQRRTRKGLAE
jgi:hydroxyquinol 1,2-dioxygenase